MNPYCQLFVSILFINKSIENYFIILHELIEPRNDKNWVSNIIREKTNPILDNHF